MTTTPKITDAARLERLRLAIEFLQTAAAMFSDLQRDDEQRYKGDWEQHKDDLLEMLECDDGEAGLVPFYRILQARRQ